MAPPRAGDFYALRPSAPLPHVPTPDEILRSPNGASGGAGAQDGEAVGSAAPDVQTASGPRRVMLWVVLPLLMAVAGFVLLQAVGAEVGSGGLAVGTIFALLPVVPVLAVWSWLDQNEPEPAPYLVFRSRLGRDGGGRCGARAEFSRG